jgi:UDP-N-acetyl-D-galactosamine dehydrogenase
VAIHDPFIISDWDGVTHYWKIAVIGFGYVGLPVAVSFVRTGCPVVGFDIDERRISERAGYHPEVILAGRRINDNVGQRVALACVQALFRRHCVNAIVTVLGITFKENVPDTRNSKVADIVRELESAGATVQVHDPLASADEAKHEYGIALMASDALRPADAVILAVSHVDYVRGGWPLISRLLRGGDGLVFDVKSVLDRGSKPAGIELWRL